VLRFTLESFALSKYMVVLAAPPAIPDGRGVDVALAGFFDALSSISVSTNSVSALARALMSGRPVSGRPGSAGVAGVVPDGVMVPVVPGRIVDAFHGFRQPVTVIVSLAVAVAEGVCGLGVGFWGVCAVKARLATASPAQAAKMVLLIASASCAYRTNASCARLLRRDCRMHAGMERLIRECADALRVSKEASTELTSIERVDPSFTCGQVSGIAGEYPEHRF
jgi:hypothetical protein